MFINAIKNLKQEIGVPTLRLRPTRKKKKLLHFFVVMIESDFWTGTDISEYTDALTYWDESEAVKDAKKLGWGVKVIYNYGYPSENVIYEA